MHHFGFLTRLAVGGAGLCTAAVALLGASVAPASAAATAWLHPQDSNSLWVAGEDTAETVVVYRTQYPAGNARAGQAALTIFDFNGSLKPTVAPCEMAEVNGYPKTHKAVVCPWSMAPRVLVAAAGGNDVAVMQDIDKPTEIYGGNGNDTITGGSVADKIYGDGATTGPGDGQDTIRGGRGDDTIYGGSNPDPTATESRGDMLYGDEGHDTLNGGPGHDDRVEGGIGRDVLNGGDGNGDSVSYRDRSASVAIKPSVGAGGGSVSGNVDDDIFFAGSGVRDFVAPDVENYWGGEGNDSFYPGATTRGMRGFGGNDYFVSVSGEQRVKGDDGNDDTVSYSDPWRGSLASQAVTVSLAERKGGVSGENDSIDDVERVVGSKGDDTITGSNADETLEGGDGNDLIDGGRGADVIAGNAGTDVANYLSRSTKIVATIGQPGPGESPSARGGGSADDGNEIQDRSDDRSRYDNITSTTEAIYSGSGDDELSGNKLNNVILGLAGGDRIEGGEGADWLLSAFIWDAGDDGYNFLDGGPGNDLLLGANASDEIHGGPGVDNMNGFSGADWLVTNDDGPTDLKDEVVECAGPNPPNTQYDSGSKPVNEDWADLDVADAPIAKGCENIAEPPPDESDFELCDPANPTSEACRDDF